MACRAAAGRRLRHLRRPADQDPRGVLAPATWVAAKPRSTKGSKHRLGNDHDVLKLERAVIDLANGKPKEAEQLLREVRDHFDHLEQKAIGENALSMLTDANRKAYAGEDYEKVLVRVLLDAFQPDGRRRRRRSLCPASGRQAAANHRQPAPDKKATIPSWPIKRVAVGAYIHGMLREATHSNFDDVARAAATLVCSWQPDFPYARQDLERARHGHHSAPGNGVLYVFTLVGIGPYKEETLEMPSTRVAADRRSHSERRSASRLCRRRSRRSRCPRSCARPTT